MRIDSDTLQNILCRYFEKNPHFENLIVIDRLQRFEVVVNVAKHVITVFVENHSNKDVMRTNLIHLIEHIDACIAVIAPWIPDYQI